MLKCHLFLVKVRLEDRYDLLFRYGTVELSTWDTDWDRHLYGLKGPTQIMQGQSRDHIPEREGEKVHQAW